MQFHLIPVWFPLKLYTKQETVGSADFEKGEFD